MNTRTSLLFILFMTALLFGQGYHIAIAENGLNIREKPDLAGNKIGQLYVGAKVKIVEKTGIKLTVTENGTDLHGEWVKIKFSNYPLIISEAAYPIDSGYVFNRFLKPIEQVWEELNQEILAISIFQGFTIDTSKTPFFVKGDFLGDHVSDYAILLKKEKEPLRIGIIDKGGKKHQILKSVDLDAKDRIIDEFDFVGVFRKVKRGEVLWTNWSEAKVDSASEGRQSFDEVPENEKVVLTYDALYVHAAESCGGGFMYWYKGRFLWLQQE